MQVLLDALKGRFSETQLRRLPRVYRALFRDVKYKGGDVGVFFMQLETAQADLERADPLSKVSPGVLGYFALEGSGLSESEQAHVLSLTGLSIEYSRVKSVVLDLYPYGSLRGGSRGQQQQQHQQRQQGWQKPWRPRQWGYAAVDDSDTVMDDSEDQSSGWDQDPEYEQAEAWLAQEEEYADYCGDHLATLANQADADGGNADELHEASAWAAEELSLIQILRCRRTYACTCREVTDSST